MRTILAIIFFTSAQIVIADEDSSWSKIKTGAAEITSKSLEVGADLLDQSKQSADSAATFVSETYSSAKENVSSWSKEKYAKFSEEYPEVATNIDIFSEKASGTSGYIYEKSKDGLVTAYYTSASGVKTAVEWTDSKIEELPQITACGIAELDMLGGVAIGSLGTALTAGSSSIATTKTIVSVVPSVFGWVPIATTSVTSIVSTPAVAVGVTATAIAGATVYASSKGLCYMQQKKARRNFSSNKQTSAY